MIAMNLSKQQAVDADPKAIQHISFTGNVGRDRNTTMFFLNEEAKETVLFFFTRNCESIVNLFCFKIVISI